MACVVCDCAHTIDKLLFALCCIFAGLSYGVDFGPMSSESEVKRAVDKFVSKVIALDSIKNVLVDDHVYIYQQFNGGERLW